MKRWGKPSRLVPCCLYSGSDVQVVKRQEQRLSMPKPCSEDPRRRSSHLFTRRITRRSVPGVVTATSSSGFPSPPSSSRPVSMFAHSVQPALVSLFSSTGSDPLALWAICKDDELPADSVVCLLEDKSSAPAPPEPAKLIQTADGDGENGLGEGYTVSQAVLHIQSPTLRKTYVRCPPTGSLGMKHPWIHLQVRNLGKECSFEVGIMDRAGREGIVRFSTFQVLSSLSQMFGTRDLCNEHLLRIIPRWKSREAMRLAV